MTIKPDKIFAVVDEAGVAAYTQIILKGIGAGKGVLDVTGDIGSQFNYFGTAVAPYDRHVDETPKDKDGNTYKKLMPIEDVLKILTIPGDRQKAYASEFATAFSDSGYELDAEDDMRHPLEIVSGTSPIGFAVSVLRVAGLPIANDVRHATNLYVLEDQHENRVVVLGDQKISPYLEKSLREEGLIYLHYTNPTAINQINDLFGDGLKARASRDMSFRFTDIQNIMQNVIYALSLQQEALGNDDGESHEISAGTTIGKFFVDVFKLQKHLDVDPAENATLMLRSTPKAPPAIKR